MIKVLKQNSSTQGKRNIYIWDWKEQKGRGREQVSCKVEGRGRLKEWDLHKQMK